MVLDGALREPQQGAAALRPEQGPLTRFRGLGEGSEVRCAAVPVAGPLTDGESGSRRWWQRP
ncbi:hypothetical protein GCM10025787_53230 [Saccharopolyspora rosea]